MDRRSFLGTAALSCFSLGRETRQFGWIPNHGIDTPSFYQSIRKVKTKASCCLYDTYEAVVGHPWLAHDQKSYDCVAHAAGAGLDLLACQRVADSKIIEKWQGKSSTDMIYSGGRNLVGRSRRRDPGMYCSWAVKYLNQYGNLIRQSYPPYDLTKYTKETVNYWNRIGIPDSLLIEAKKHPLISYAKVNSVEEMADAITTGYHPVLFCAMLGAENNRLDEDGFLQPRGRWAHAWLAAGVDNNPRRPGICLINSHSIRFGQGPRHLNNPQGSCWVDFDIMDYHIRNSGECYALTDYRGFKGRDYVIW